MGASDEIIYSLAPKSVTTPIAMEVTKSIGGIPALTAAVVVCVGLLGGILGFKTMKLTHIGSPMAQGLSLGQQPMLSAHPQQWTSAANTVRLPASA